MTDGLEALKTPEQVDFVILETAKGLSGIQYFHCMTRYRALPLAAPQ
jgi:hypothetical protein